MGTNDILNSEGDKDLIAESAIDIANKCVRLDVKDEFVSSITVNTRRSSAFISAVNDSAVKINVQHISFFLLITRT